LVSSFFIKEIKWLKVEELKSIEWAPADVPAVNIITGEN